MRNCEAILFECAELENRILIDILDEGVSTKAKNVVYKIINTLYEAILSIIDDIQVTLYGFKKLENKWLDAKLDDVKNIKVSKRIAGTSFKEIFDFFENEMVKTMRVTQHQMVSKNSDSEEIHYSIFLHNITDFEGDKINKKDFVKKLNEYFQTSSNREYSGNEIKIDSIILNDIKNAVINIDKSSGYLAKLRKIKIETKTLYKVTLKALDGVFSSLGVADEEAVTEIKKTSKAALSAEMLALNTLHKYIIDYYKELSKINISKSNEN